MEHKNKAEEKSINKTISDQFEEIKEQMCEHYCKYVENWDEDDGPIEDAICKSCPLTRL